MPIPPFRRSKSPKDRLPAGRAFPCAAVALGLALLTGCQAVVDSAPRSQVRLVAVSPDAPALDFYEGPNALAYNLGFGALTSYIAIPPGAYTIAANTTGTRQTLSSAKVILAASTQYTVLVGNPAATLQQLLLTDQSQTAPPGQISLRFIDQATRTGAVDVYLVPSGQKLAAVPPLLSGVALNTNTGYLDVPTGAYTLVMLPAGVAPATSSPAAYTGTKVAYTAGSARTIILVDQQFATTPGLQIITTDDFDPPTSS